MSSHGGCGRLIGWLMGMAIVFGMLWSGDAFADSTAVALQFRNPETWVQAYQHTAAGGKTSGDKTELIEAVRDGYGVGVTWLSWHGEVSAICDEVVADLDGRIECKTVIRCSGEQGTDIGPHRHRSRLYTSGKLLSAVIVPKNADEEKIYAAGIGPSPMTWFRSRRPLQARGDDPFVAVR